MNRWKMRAWDDKNGVMLSWEQLCDANDWACSLGVLTNQMAHHLTFMMPTCRKDCKGVQIHERDIIEGLHCYGPGGWHTQIAPILWDERHGYQWQYWDMATVKVIGNMMENPDLLARKK